MFTCVVPCCSASTILALESFANFTEGAGTVNLTGAISVDIIMHGDERPFVSRFGLQVRR